MNIDGMLATLLEWRGEFLLLGGVNFMLRHQPVLTYDLDVWVRPTAANLRRCEKALAALQAEWGRTESDWRPVAGRRPGWLGGQAVYCMICAGGALDVFLQVRGLGAWPSSRAVSVEVKTAAGIVCRGLSDRDMLRCQEALPDNERKADRIRTLRQALGEPP